MAKGHLPQCHFGRHLETGNTERERERERESEYLTMECPKGRFNFGQLCRVQVLFLSLTQRVLLARRRIDFTSGDGKIAKE